MESSSIVISQHVINSVKGLPESDRHAVATALAEEILLGKNPDDTLSPFQSMLYSIIQFYVKRDTEKAARHMASLGVATAI